MLNIRDNKTSKLMSRIVIVLVVLAMVVPTILGALMSIF